MDALAFVDDDPVERAEVASALPQVLVLTPAEAAEAAGWPEFSPPVVTAEARRRGQAYAERRQRQAGPAGVRRDPGGVPALGRHRRRASPAASQADLPRLAELAVRTRQFNSAAGQRLAGEAPQDWFTGLLADPATDVLTVRLRDSFGDDGMVGACVVARGDPAAWTVRLLMISCRAMGRGVAEALLAWLARRAASHGARALRVPCTIDERNLPLRLALAGTGFRATTPAAAAASGPAPAGLTGAPPPAGLTGGQAPASDATGPATGLFERELAGPLPGLASWVHPDPQTPLPGPGPEPA